ncbi:alanine racemase [Rhodococcus sp. NBC_00297]|uniref:alanine racemase n=1 Tax=Rhodococcus sp. NBC_00297 TaxID=2976005 RepID=UPI003FA723D3
MTPVNSAQEVPTSPVAPAPTSRPQAEALIDLDAVAHNIRILIEHAGDAAVMAVVKADGYNHGGVEVARAALAAGARELGVATAAEALGLRTAGLTAPVLCWLHAPGTDFTGLIDSDVEIGVSSPRQIAEVGDAARRVGRPAVVSLKVDTGMNRNGVGADEFDAAVDALVAEQRGGALRVRGLFSHLVDADVPGDPINDRQKERFDAAADAMARAGVAPEVRHIANSAGALTRPDLAYDMVRPGIALYGLSPAPHLGWFGLRPVMTLRATVILLKRVAAGDGVSYGHEWIAPVDTTVALLPVGYADGITRALKNRYEVSIHGVRYPAVGRVCMDQIVVDLGPGRPDVAEGDTAYLFGPGDHGEPTAQDWAETLDTINYEVVTGIRGRVRRTFAGGVS